MSLSKLDHLSPDEPLPLALSSSQREYEIAFECIGVTDVRLAVQSGLAVAATSLPLIQPSWQALEAGVGGLPTLGNVLLNSEWGKTRVIRLFSISRKSFASM